MSPKRIFWTIVIIAILGIALGVWTAQQFGYELADFIYSLGDIVDGIKTRSGEESSPVAPGPAAP